MERVKVDNTLALGLWHEVKVMARSCSAQSALIGHRLLFVTAPGSALAGKWVEDCEVATGLDDELEFDEELGDQLDPTVRGAIVRKLVRPLGS